jgi:hypothetical protein
MTILYMLLTLKWLYNKLDYRTVNELKYIILTQRVIIVYNVTYLLT